MSKQAEQPAEGVKTRGRRIAEQSITTTFVGGRQELIDFIAPIIDHACEDAVAEAIVIQQPTQDTQTIFIRGGKKEPASFHAALLEKFPSFDPSWQPEQQQAWFTAYGKLLAMSGSESPQNPREARIQELSTKGIAAADQMVVNTDPELAAIVAANAERLKNAPKKPMDMTPLDTTKLPGAVRKSNYGIAW